jgi:hypothetical protein
MLHTMLASASSALGRALGDTDSVAHRGLRGSMREAAFHDMLQDYLPKAYELARGEVHAVGAGPSRQQDCLILDCARSVPFLRLGTEAIYPIECVRGSVEIKSRYTTA